VLATVWAQYRTGSVADRYQRFVNHRHSHCPRNCPICLDAEFREQVSPVVMILPISVMNSSRSQNPSTNHIGLDVVPSSVIRTPHKPDPIVAQKNDVTVPVATKYHPFVA
jgi:hypothetical protein